MPDLNMLVMEALKTVNDPELNRDLVSLNMIKGVSVDGGIATVNVELTTPACPLKDQISREVAAAVGKVPGVVSVKVNFTAQVRAQPRSTAALAGVKHVVAVGSGKGGVGKSTVAANLALALSLDGARVGLMDLDVMGPSIPLIMGVQGQFPEGGPDGKAIPVPRLGLGVMSWGFFLPAQDAMVVRGPILAGVVQRFLNDVSWGELDYLIIDLPPGTGDIQLTLCQAMPLTGAVIVTTPQDVALLVATKAISMMNTMKTPILGIVENMSSFECPHCHKNTNIFGHGGARETAERLHIPFLGEIPLDAAIRHAENDGVPIVKARPDSVQAKAFRECARALAGRISIRAMGGDGIDRIMAKARTLFRAAPAPM